MTTYGFIGSEGIIEQNYLDLDMLSYRNKNNKYVLVTENIKTHTIEIRSHEEKICLKGAVTDREKKRPGFSGENQLQLDVMKKLADYLKEGDVLMFRTVQDLSCDKDYAYLIYSEFIAKDIQLEFLYDPTCNFSIYRKDYINSPAVINNLIPQILTAALSIPVGRKTLGVLKGQKKRRNPISDQKYVK